MRENVDLPGYRGLDNLAFGVYPTTPRPALELIYFPLLETFT